MRAEKVDQSIGGGGIGANGVRRTPAILGEMLLPAEG